MTRGRNRRTKSPVHRLGLTHGQEGVPKFIRENTDQFFAAATSRQSKTISASNPLIATEFEQQQQNNNNNKNDVKKEENRLIISTPKPLTPIITLPPIRTASSSRKQQTLTSASLCIRQQSLPPLVPSPTNSLESSTPILESPTLLPRPKHRFRQTGPIDRDIFRKAYERALSVARSRLLFRDPYSLTRASATHGILYSYYDHTPMCIFSRGTDCNHLQDKTNKQERKSKLKSNILRKKIFNDVNVEHYIR